MKNSKLAISLTSITLLITTTSIPSAPVVAQTERVGFYCGYTQDGNLFPATMVGVSGREREPRTLIVWKNNTLSFAPKQRCEIVSRKFQAAWDRHNFNYLITGTDRKTGRGLICAVRDRSAICDVNKMLFTVVDRQNARNIIQEIYDSMQKTSNPSYQTDPNQSIDMQELIKSIGK
jgi:Circadian oscillating protein COP23